MFSSRVPSDLTPNRMTRALEHLRAAGVDLIDLTETNPTRVGLDYPEGLLAPLAAPCALCYDPLPFGLPAARQAVSADFARRGLEVPPDRVVLTASTSEAYSLLFKLLCDPGDEVLIPHPSYPLFEHLTRLDGVTTRPYLLDERGHWSLDPGAVRAALSPRTRAVLVVSPNNPTGSHLKAHELAELAEVCATRGIALIGDEVFADYVPASREPLASVLTQTATLAFGLGGLSKSAGLPQLKLGWIGVSGPDVLVRAALARLEIICDTYLSVGTPVQQAAGALLANGAAVRRQILDRVTQNRDALAALAARHPSCTVLPMEGGWSSVLQVPATRTEETFALSLLERDHVLVHPGFFFDFPHEAFLVVSLLPSPPAFERGVRAMLRRAEAISPDA